MRGLSVLIKPASGKCNLACTYCFYHDVMKNRETKDFGFMSIDTLEILIKKVFALDLDVVTLAFQGGEPMLVGLDFYSELIGLVERYNKAHIKVQYVIQTNGTLIDDKWAEFFSAHQFLVGLSIDGNKETHDFHRMYKNGKGTYTQVIKATKLLERYKVDYNVIVVISRFVAKHITKLYNHLKKQGFTYLQFIPCLDGLGDMPGGNSYSLLQKDYSIFLNTLFDLWYKDLITGKQIYIRMFDNLVGIAMGYEPESCDMREGCSVNLVVEADGSVYPCDFYVLDEWKMGSILTDDMMELLNSSLGKQFVDESMMLIEKCRQCDVFYLCKGGCKRQSDGSIVNDDPQHYYCRVYKDFYTNNQRKIHHLARAFMK